MWWYLLTKNCIYILDRVLLIVALFFGKIRECVKYVNSQYIINIEVHFKIHINACAGILKVISKVVSH